MQTILVIEDDYIMLKAMKNILNKGGYNVLTATNGKEAFQMLDTTDHDIVITDLMMPHAGGLEVVSRVRKDPSKKGIGIMVVSSMGHEEMVTEAFSLGADDYLKKPIMAGELISRIKRLLTNKNIYRDSIKTSADNTIDKDHNAPELFTATKPVPHAHKPILLPAFDEEDVSKTLVENTQPAPSKASVEPQEALIMNDVTQVTIAANTPGPELNSTSEPVATVKAPDGIVTKQFTVVDETKNTEIEANTAVVELNSKSEPMASVTAPDDIVTKQFIVVDETKEAAIEANIAVELSSKSEPVATVKTPDDIATKQFIVADEIKDTVEAEFTEQAKVEHEMHLNNNVLKTEVETTEEPQYVEKQVSEFEKYVETVEISDLQIANAGKKITNIEKHDNIVIPKKNSVYEKYYFNIIIIAIVATVVIIGICL